MSDTTELLDSLRDIHEPAEPAGTSLLLLAGNAALILAIIVFLAWRFYWRRNTWRRQALSQLKHARNSQPEQRMLKMARLLRQIMLRRQQDCRQKTGKAYLQLLDSTFDTSWFTSGDGKCFGEELYQPVNTDPININQIEQKLETLIKALPNTGNPGA